jgi:adenine-specific DNA-methyltransferase
VADDERAPGTVLYPRDPSLDPQLVWKGKDEQDREDLAVPVVPIYIQEKIHPHAIINDLKARVKETHAEEQMTLFGDFNGIEDFDKKIDFYHHESNWSNRMILGDSLLVMTSLAEKEGLKGKVQTIYIDPPYGIKFGSNWQVSTRKRDITDGKVEDATRQPEQIRAFRDTWKLGVHSYLAYIRDRLTVARELLTETGSILVQIGDENVHLVRCVLDEVFGTDNFITQITFSKTSGSTREYLGGTSDFLLFYAKSREHLKFRQPYFEKSVESEAGGPYSLVELADGTRRRMTASERNDPSLIPSKARVYRLDNLQSQSIGREKGEGASCWFPVEHAGKQWLPNSRSRWKTNERGMAALKLARRLESTETGLYYVRYIDDFPAIPIADNWTDTVVAGFASDKKYVVETSTKVVERCLLMTSDPGDIVLDPTCGSAATAYVAEQWGRRWITIDTSRVALTLARTRLMGARFPYYLLADSTEGVKKEAAVTGKMPPSHTTEGDIRKGFVYKNVPHVTLKSITTNPDLKERMSREEVERAIARYSDVETLFDKPYADANRIRVTGPFTVESVSPHRVLSTAEEKPESEASAARESSSDFASMIIENLRKAGIQNTVKNERLKFLRLDPFPGAWVHATGEYEEADGTTKRVAVSIGPEHGTVGPGQVKEAAKEAVQGIGHDLLYVCGFAFDPHVSEEAKRYGKLAVQITRMNPDLAMGDELLKKTGAGNLFMVFGEPDVEVRLLLIDGPPEGMNGEYVEVEIKGVDVYDPTTGQIRNASTDDIACWFLDTDYDGESFFVRHAYFCGGDEPYEKLKRALRAEIDEAAWSSLYSTTSRPFRRPRSGKIALKVINHYGDEVLKVLPV